jgi:hypothetical protein
MAMTEDKEINQLVKESLIENIEVPTEIQAELIQKIANHKEPIWVFIRGIIAAGFVQMAIFFMAFWLLYINFFISLTLFIGLIFILITFFLSAFILLHFLHSMNKKIEVIKR